MTAQASLARAASHIDDALENLTFFEHQLVFDDLCLGCSALLDAVVESERTREIEGFARGVARLRARVARHGAAAEEALMEELTFAGSDAIVRVARAQGLVDPGRVYGSLAGAWTPSGSWIARFGLPEPQGVQRRTMLQMLAAGSAGLLGACRSEAAEAPPASPGEREPSATAAQTPEPAMPPATVRALTSINAMQWPTSDPFLFCAYHVDHYPAGDGNMAPEASLDGRSLGRDFDPERDWRMYHGRTIPGFPRHPHRGFETVTVVRSGMLDHTDSIGATARFGGGDVQWLTAGGGIQHAEMFPLLHTDRNNPTELFQIWMNLPARNKMVDPHFTMFWREDIPRVTVRDDAGRTTDLTLSAGTYGEHTPPSPPPDSWASQPDSDVAIWTGRMDAGARFEFPAVHEGTERSVYLHRGGGATVAGTQVDTRHRVELEGHGPAVIEAGDTEVEWLLMQGRPIGEPVARRGPFVMNTQEEIRQAYADYRSTGFGGWPWQDDAPVHDASQGRFALRPDGTREEPA